jgi:hypothetical protein
MIIGTAEFVPLDKTQVQKVRTRPSNPNNEQNLYNYTISSAGSHNETTRPLIVI